MQVFVIQVADRPIVAVAGASKEEVERIYLDREGEDGDEFAQDLLEIESDGQPIWDGTTPLVLRLASPEEAKEFHEGLAEAAEDEGEPIEADDYVMFLVPIDEDDEADRDETSTA